MKILYFMHVDWHWIKQRPQFLAEQLAALPGIDLLAVYPYAIRRVHMVKNVTSAKLRAVPMVPFSRFKFLQKINEYLHTIYLGHLIRSFKPDVLWFTFPGLVPSRILARFPGIRVVYDCMDDALEFRSEPTERENILKCEKALLAHADLVLASSQNLLQKVISRGACLAKVNLVRNAFNGKLFSLPQAQPQRSGTVFRFLYFGTIANYIDFDALLYCLQKVGGIEFHFVGPVTTACPRHERLIFHDPVAHDRLADFARTYDCFVMPFRVNELIRGVDPVKLYEYINFNKNILSVYYPELARFSDFVSFYQTRAEFVDRVKSLSGEQGLRYRAEQRIQFLSSNTWPARAAEIRGYLGLLKGPSCVSMS